MKHTQLTKIILTSTLAISAFCTPALADVKSLYQETCATCHDSGALNAPKKGDSAKWNALKQTKGMATLVKETKQGLPQMPANGLCAQCSDQDFEALINYMSQ